MKTIIALLFVSLSVFAEEDCDDFRLIDENFLRMGQQFNWNAATTADLNAAPCKSKHLPSVERMNAAINLPGTASEEAHGVRFENESPELIRAFRELATARDFFGTRPRPEEQVNFQATHAINPECKKVSCAVSKIWGPELGRKILYLKLAHGFNASEYSIVSAKRFTEAELNDVLLALGDLPPHLTRIATPNQQLVRLSRDPLDRQGRTEGNAMINLYDPWAQNSPMKRQYVVFHELAHNISHHLGDLDSSLDWLGHSGWTKLGHDWETNENHCRVSNYGSTNPDEDFAETLSSYRYNARDLKSRCPQKYEWMRSRVFRGREYLDPNACG